MNDLQQWVGQNKTPLAFLVPSNSGTADTATANQSRYDLLVQSLATQSKVRYTVSDTYHVHWRLRLTFVIVQIAIVPLTDQPDRGLVIFATPQSQTQGRSRGRLMAAVCFVGHNYTRIPRLLLTLFRIVHCLLATSSRVRR
jgi:hypothetical protein